MIIPKMGNRLITFIKIQTTKFRTHIETKQQNSEHILKPTSHMKYQVIQQKHRRICPQSNISGEQ